MPPTTVARELLPERSFGFAWCWFIMISIPKIEKPRDKLIKLILLRSRSSVVPVD